jgi:hypothetical protein
MPGIKIRVEFRKIKKPFTPQMILFFYENQPSPPPNHRYKQKSAAQEIASGYRADNILLAYKMLQSCDKNPLCRKFGSKRAERTPRLQQPS